MKINKNGILLLALVIATIFMGIGYSAINSITGDIKGKATANNQDGVFITDVEYVSDIDANLNNSKIENFLGTMMKSTVELSESNTKSEIKYKVTVYNNAVEAAVFEKVTYGEEFYDNEEITYEIEGFTPGQTIGSKETKEIIITFKYKDQTTVPANKILNSYLNFEMIVPNRMVLAQKGDNTSKYLTGSILKNQIESVKFEKGEEPTSTDILASFDASEKQDESIIGYYTDTDNNGLYELTFISDKTIFSNKNAQYLFSNLNNVQSFEFDNFSTTGTTSFLGMFQGCNKITALDLNNWDTSNVISFGNTYWSYGGMFQDCISLEELKIENWNMAQAKDISSMFRSCKSLTNISLNKWNTNNIEQMQYVFSNCTQLVKIELGELDTSNVKSMNNMFNNCTALSTLDLKKWNTGNVTGMQGMFQNCKSLLELDVSGFNTSQVTGMGNMFEGCSELLALNVKKWDTSNVTNMRWMFSGCKKLTTLDVNEFETTKVTKMDGMFYDCSTLTELDLSGFNTSQVTNMSQMFYNCSTLTELDVSGFNTSL